MNFNDCLGKQELVNDLVLNTILPKEWQTTAKIPEGEEEPEAIPINEGQELVCVYLDVQGSFSARKFNDKVK